MTTKEKSRLKARITFFNTNCPKGCKLAEDCEHHGPTAILGLLGEIDFLKKRLKEVQTIKWPPVYEGYRDTLTKKGTWRNRKLPAKEART